MAKRFIDTGFYKSPFVRSLQGASKALYSFIICDCTGAGIWMKDLEVASVYIGLPLDERNFAPFVESGKAVEVAAGKFFFPDFIDHQYPSGLSEKNAAHKNFLEELLKYNVLQKMDDGAFKPLQRTFEGPKVMVMVKEDVMVTEEVTETSREEKTETGLAVIQKTKARPESPEEALAYLTELGRPDQINEFLDYYSSNGWKVGRNPMKDWKATARRWVRNANPVATNGDPDRKLLRDTTVRQFQENRDRFVELMNQNKQ